MKLYKNRQVKVSKKKSIESTTKKPVEKALRDPDGPSPASRYIMSISVHSFWTDRGRVDPGQMRQCGGDIADKLIKAGLAEPIVVNPDDVGTEPVIELPADGELTADGPDWQDKTRRPGTAETPMLEHDRGIKRQVKPAHKKPDSVTSRAVKKAVAESKKGGPFE